MTNGYEIQVSVNILQVQLISGLNLKQLQRLILILSCAFLLPFGYEAVQGVSAHPDKAPQVVTYHGSHLIQYCSFPHYKEASVRKFRLRTRALLDFNEFFLTVSSIRIKPVFAYIHPRYKGLTFSYISVSVALNNWRGPPVA